MSGVTQQQFGVAYVVAVSAHGTGAVAAEQSYGVTYGNGEWGGVEVYERASSDVGWRWGWIVLIGFSCHF